MSTKDDLMASLMMGGGASGAVVSENNSYGNSNIGTKNDLFNDDIDFQNDPPPLATPENAPMIQSALSTNGFYSTYSEAQEILPSLDAGPSLAPVAPPPASAPPPKPSMLAESGLLGFANGSPENALFQNDANKESIANGGLFDDIDQQEAQEQEKKRLDDMERSRLEAENLERQRQQLEMEAEKQRKQLEEQAAADRRRLEQEQLYQKTLQDQMQSINLGASGLPNGNMYANSQPSLQSQKSPSQFVQSEQHLANQAQYDDIPVKRVAVEFYRDHEPPLPQVPNNQLQSSYASPVPVQQVGSQQQQPFNYQPHQPGNYNSGFHSQNPNNLMQPQLNPNHAPPPIQQPMYGRVTVSDAVMVQSQSMFGIRQPPHWSYQVATQILPQPPHNPNGGVWLVRRRFRHVVALEDRLREDCPGAILPPRPEKHATRAIEEVSSSQSAEFALQRAAELQVYLNELVVHPICFKSPMLRLFLALQDDIGTTWSECSANAFTRIANASVGAAMKVSESATGTKLPWQSDGTDDIGYGEDNAELLALQTAESIRMGLVQQAVPKLEGAVTLLREYAELMGTTGMEMSRLGRELQIIGSDHSQVVDVLSSGMLRGGRRSKRLSVELAAAIHSFQHHHKICKYEKYAFYDRKHALQRRQKERVKADQRAAQLLMHQRAAYVAGGPYQQQHYQYGNQDRMAQEAATADLYATDVWNEADHIGLNLKNEVHRCAWNRRNEWTSSVKIIASCMKEAVTERVAIWETVQDNFLQLFPEYRESSVYSSEVTNSMALSINNISLAPSSESVIISAPNNLAP